MNILRAYFMMIVVIVGVLIGEARCQQPKPAEHDPGAWAFTTGFTSSVTGTFTRPWIGLAAGIGLGVAANLQNSNNARQNMVGSVIGSVAGYAIIKTLKHDWHHRRH